MSETTIAPTHVLPGGERLEAILAAAAPFTDRASGEHFQPVPGGGIRERTTRWLNEAAADGATARLVLAGRAGRELGAGLGDVRLRDPRRLPDWAEALVAFLEAQPATADDDDVSGRPGSILGSIPRAADRLLGWDDGTLSGIEIAPSGREGIVGALGVRLWYALEPSIRFELRLRRRDDEDPAAAVLDASLEGWLRRFELLPGLAYVAGLTCRQWRTAVTELFDRLRDDLPLLRRELWDGADPGPLTSFSGDAGDRHDDGRAVALLGFASGRGAVYKPKDLTHAVAFMDVCAFLNEHGLPLDLPTRAILPRDGYGWEERAVAAPCADRGGFARFYRRLGMLVRLAQLLEGRDLWADNLLACGEHPTLIDLECLLYPRVTPPPTLPRAKRELLAEYEETIARTGILHQPWVPREELPIRDLGCLSDAGDSDLPLPPYRPTCAGEVADGSRYGDEIAAGYREMQETLLANRDGLRAPRGPLARFESAQVRYIWRHTWDCQRILRVSTSPRALRGGVEREIVLARVLRDAYAMLGGHRDRHDLPAVAEAELDAFRRLDVPLFLARTDASSPFTPDGHVIADHLQGTAWARLQARLDGIADFALDDHLAVVTACLDAARGGAEGGPLRGVRRRAGLGDRELERIAAEIGDAIAAARLRTSDAAGWLGLSWYPVPDLRQVEIVSRDLLTGSAAVAVYLAELGARTGGAEHLAAAREALGDLVDLVGGSFAFTSELRLAGGSPVPGGYAGAGGALYALARCAPLLDDPALLDAARALVAPGLADVRSGRACADVPFGSAGLLLDVLRLRAETGPDEEVDAAVDELADAAALALPDPDARMAPYAATSTLADLVPTGRDSIAAALARAGRADAVVGHRFDLTRRGGRLAAIEAARALGRPAPALEIPAVLGCRGLVATAGEALAAGDRDTAARLFRELADRRRASGRWFGDRGLDDRLNLSALDGTVAVGNLALALLDNDFAPPTLLR